MKILFLVHVEEMFRDHFPSMYVPRVCKAMQQYDRVYIFVSGINDDKPIRELHDRRYEHVDWAWGYEREMFEDNLKEMKWVIDNFVAHPNNHPSTWVPPELRDKSQWEGHSISLGGGCRHECLQNMISVLEYQQIPFRLVEGLTYGCKWCLEHG